MKNVFQIAVIIILTTLVFSPIQASAQFFFLENRDIGREVQDFTLKTLGGEEVNLKEFRDGKKTIIFFWATWCPHCRDALKVLNQKKEEIREKDIKIVLVDVGEKGQIVKRYITRNKIEMDVLLDEGSEVSDAYGLVGVPTFYFVNEEGIIENVLHELPANPEAGFLGY